MTRMLWNRIKDLDCPKSDCEGHLQANLHWYDCDVCHFIINKDRFLELLSKMDPPPARKPLETPEFYKEYLRKKKELEQKATL